MHAERTIDVFSATIKDNVLTLGEERDGVMLWTTIPVANITMHHADFHGDHWLMIGDRTLRLTCTEEGSRELTGFFDRIEYAMQELHMKESA